MLLPAEKPRFFPLSKTRMSGWAALILATESSVEPLSTTMTFRDGYRHSCNAPRHSIVSAQPFQFKTTQLTCGCAFNSVVLTSHERPLCCRLSATQSESPTRFRACLCICSNVVQPESSQHHGCFWQDREYALPTRTSYLL